jgi:hypothetical protein
VNECCIMSRTHRDRFACGRSKFCPDFGTGWLAVCTPRASVSLFGSGTLDFHIGTGCLACHCTSLPPPLSSFGPTSLLFLGHPSLGGLSRGLQVLSDCRPCLAHVFWVAPHYILPLPISRVLILAQPDRRFCLWVLIAIRRETLWD